MVRLLASLDAQPSQGRWWPRAAWRMQSSAKTQGCHTPRYGACGRLPGHGRSCFVCIRRRSTGVVGDADDLDCRADRSCRPCRRRARERTDLQLDPACRGDTSTTVRRSGGARELDRTDLDAVAPARERLAVAAAADHGVAGPPVDDALPEPRALVARVQRARARRGRAPRRAALRAPQVPRDRLRPTSTSSSWSASPACRQQLHRRRSPSSPPDGLTAARAARGDLASARTRSSTQQLTSSETASSSRAAARRDVRPRQARASCRRTSSRSSTSASAPTSSRSSRRSRSIRATRSRTCATRASTSASCSRARTRAGAGLRRRPGADDAAAPHRGAGVCRSTRRREARVRAARGRDRAPRRRRSSRACALRGVYPFRVTRNCDLEIDEEEARGPPPDDPAGAPAPRSRQRGAPRGRLGEPTPDVSVQRLCRALEARSRARRVPRRRPAQRRRSHAASVAARRAPRAARRAVHARRWCRRCATPRTSSR